MQRIILLLLVILNLAACGSQNSRTNTLQGEQVTAKNCFELNGHFYTLGLPTSGITDGKAYKLLLVFHGSGGSDLAMQSMVRFESLSDDYIVVYPKSKEVEWDEGCERNIAHRLSAGMWSS